MLNTLFSFSIFSVAYLWFSNHMSTNSNDITFCFLSFFFFIFLILLKLLQCCFHSSRAKRSCSGNIRPLLTLLFNFDTYASSVFSIRHDAAHCVMYAISFIGILKNKKSRTFKSDFIKIKF